MRRFTANFLQISAIPDDQLILRASYGPSERDRAYAHCVRSRLIGRTHLRNATPGATYRYVRFDDTGQWAWVRESNIREVKHS